MNYLIPPWIFSPYLTLTIHWLHFSICLKALELDPRSADHEDSLWMDQILVTKAKTWAWHPRPFINWPLLISHSPLSKPLTHSPLPHAPKATSALQTWLNPTSFLRSPRTTSVWLPQGKGPSQGIPTLWWYKKDKQPQNTSLSLSGPSAVLNAFQVQFHLRLATIL